MYMDSVFKINDNVIYGGGGGAYIRQVVSSYIEFNILSI